MKNVKALAKLTFIIPFLIMGCNKDKLIKKSLCIQGAGPILIDTVENDFLNVESFIIWDSIDLVISQGVELEIITEGHQNMMNKVTYSLSPIQPNIANEIRIRLEENDDCYENYDYSVFVKNSIIKSIFSASSGNIIINDFDNQEGLYLEIHRSGNIELNKFKGAENLQLLLLGSGNFTGNEDISTLKDLYIYTEGSGNFNGFSIITDFCNIESRGKGDCEVHVNDTLNVHITGSGNVFYKGNPTINFSRGFSASGMLIDSN